MGIEKQGIRLQSFIFILIANFILLSNEVVNGRRIGTKSAHLAKPKGTIKTIVWEDGDVIDCVDIYKQPAFDHPLLKNHTIKEAPRAILNGIREESFQSELIQDWYENEECPEGSIPIMRTPQQIHPRSRPIIPHNRQLNYSTKYNDGGHEHAVVSLSGKKYYGAQARINVWQPATYDVEFSLAQIWLLAGSDENLNTIEAGWITNLLGKRETSLFIFWTSKGYKKNFGCYNLRCPGFVQTNRKIVVGASIRPISMYNGKQYDVYIKVYQDKLNTNWWLQLNNEVVGYWPGKIFNILDHGADRIDWGGEIVNSNSDGVHTRTQMGSGHFSGEGFGKAAFFQRVGYYDKDSDGAKDPENLLPIVSNPNCYDIDLKGNNNKVGTYFYFGGPGRTNKCT